MTDDKKRFLEILDECGKIKSCNAFILQNDNPNKCKILPSAISNSVIDRYIDAFNRAIKEREFVDYIPDSKDSQERQVIGCGKLELWEGMKNVVDNLPICNTEALEIADYNKEGNTIIYKLSTAEPTYFLSYHKKVEKWFMNGYKYFKDVQTKEFLPQKGDILALQATCGALIRGEKCYIMYEDFFNKVFKYDERVAQEVEENENEIRAINFIADSQEFYKKVLSTKQQRANMSRIIGQKRLDEIKKIAPKDIKRALESRGELRDKLAFDGDDKIIINDKSYSIIMDVLRGKISIDILTDKTLGIDNEKK